MVYVLNIVVIVKGVFQAIRDGLRTVEVDYCGHLTLLKGGIYPPRGANSVRRQNLCDYC